MSNNVPFTELDFALVKENLKTYLKGQDRFKGYDFEGTNMNVLLDVLAYNMFQQNVYTNMAFAETFLDSAQLRENVMSHAKELNYVPNSRQSATARLNLRINVDLNPAPASVSIPKGTKFNARCGASTYTFITDKTYTVFPTDGVYRISNIDVYEGRLLNEFYTVDESAEQYFVINNENVDTKSIRVYVRDNSNPNSARREYTKVNDIFGVADDDTVFYVESHFDNLYKIDFGRNRFGKQPINGNVIEIEYRVTKGEAANGAQNFTPTNPIGGFPSVVTFSTVSINGAEREGIEDIKFFAPKSIQTQERAVTERDYEILLKQRFPNIQAISVVGGDQVFPPKYGKVIISVDVEGAFGAGDSEIQSYADYIKTKTPLTIEPVFVPAQFLYASVDLTVYYDSRRTTKSPSELRRIVINRLLEYSESTLNDFNTPLRQSRVSAIVDSADLSFLSSDIRTNPIIQYVPILNDLQNPIFTFATELKRPYFFNESLGFTNYTPAIESTRLIIDGTTVTLQDDGRGNIIAATADVSNRRVFRRNLGKVNYDTGLVSLSNIVIQGYDGVAIKFTANTVKNDIDGIKDRILALREEDMRVVAQAVNK
jgi:hypothetical protein